MPFSLVPLTKENTKITHHTLPHPPHPSLPETANYASFQPKKLATVLILQGFLAARKRRALEGEAFSVAFLVHGSLALRLTPPEATPPRAWLQEARAELPTPAKLPLARRGVTGATRGCCDSQMPFLPSPGPGEDR